MTIIRDIIRPIVRDVVRAIVPAAPSSEPAQFITNGAFATDTDWTKGAGWSITGGQAVYAGGAGLEEFSQDFGALVAPLVNGNNYRVTITVVNASNVNVLISGGVGSQNLGTANAGTSTLDFTATDARTTIILRNVDGDPVTIDNVSLTPN